MLTRLALSLTVVATFRAACAHGGELDPTESSGDAVAGARADAHDLGVVALRTQDGVTCSGVLVGPRLVLSSRSCVTGVSANDCAHPAPLGGGQSPQQDRDPSTIEVLVGEEIAKLQPVARGFHVTYPTSAHVCGADIALLETDQTVPATPWKVALDPVVGGPKIRAVGFGLRKTGGPSGRKASKRGLTVGAVTATEFALPTSACLGDEGAPALDEHTGHVVGIVSRPAGDCSAPDAVAFFTRTDAFPALLERVVAPPGGAGGATGGAGATGAGSGHGCSAHHHCTKGNHCNKTTHVCEPKH